MSDITQEDVDKWRELGEKIGDAYHINQSDDTQIRGILKAVRMILRTAPGESILTRVSIVMRRYDTMRKELKKEWE